MKKLKFIGFWEYKPEDFDKVLERWTQLRVIREKAPGRFPKVIFGPFGMGGEHKGFSVYEVDNEDQMTNMAIHYHPVMTLKFVPILESARVAELYQKMKK